MYYTGYEQDIQNLLNGKSYLELDFSIPAHAEFYLKSHGGEDLLRTKYGAVYASFLQAKEEHEKAGKKSTASGGDPVAINCFVDVPAIQKKMKANGKEGVPAPVITAAAHANVSLGKVGSVYMDGYVENSKSHTRYVTLWEDIGTEELRKIGGACVASGSGKIAEPGDKLLVTSCVFEFYNAKGALINTCIASTDVTEAEASVNPIKKFAVTAPKSKKTKELCNIHVDYQSRISDDTDYSYPNITPANSKVPVMLPMSGTITFLEGYTPIELSLKQSSFISLYYTGHDSVIYKYSMSELKPKFVKAGQTVTFTLFDDWNASFPTKDFPAGLDAVLSCPFRYIVETKDAQGMVRQLEVPLTISGSKDGTCLEDYYTSENMLVYVPYITYRWGCFGKDTKIQMADGSQKQVSDIQAGDRIMLYKGGVAEVRQMMTGIEKSLYHIETTTGQHIALTDNHPVLTARGTVLASKLNITDLMVMADGSQAPIRHYYTEEYGDKVYNLDLGAANMILANGFVSGDLGSQNSCMAASEKKQISPEGAALQKEMKELRAYLRGQ